MGEKIDSTKVLKSAPLVNTHSLEKKVLFIIEHF